MQSTAPQPQSEGLPPESNHGGRNVSRPVLMGWGWLQGTIKADLRAVGDLLGRYLGPVESLDRGLQWYQQAAKVGLHGSVIGWQPRGASEDRDGEVFFSITQTECDRLGLDQVAELARGLRELGAVHWTRVDCYVDDPLRRVSPREVRDTLSAGQAVTHVQRWRLVEDGGRATGSTCYLGHSSSLAMLRIYDKDAESGDQEGTRGIRWEMVARDERAEVLVLMVLLATPEARGEAFACLLVNLVDFRGRERDEHGNRAPRLAWWASLVGDVERVKLAVQVVASSMEKLERWIERQAAPTLALILTKYGGDVDCLLRLAVGARHRVKQSRWLMLQAELGGTVI